MVFIYFGFIIRSAVNVFGKTKATVQKWDNYFAESMIISEYSGHNHNNLKDEQVDNSNSFLDWRQLKLINPSKHTEAYILE